MKATILFWAALGVLTVVGVAFLLVTGPRARKPGQMSREEMVAFADQLDGRLYRLERQYDSVRAAVGAVGSSESLRSGEKRLALCRALIDSTRREQDVGSLRSLHERLSAAYRAARSGLGRVAAGMGDGR